MMKTSVHRNLCEGVVEETAGNILGILPSPDVLLAEPVEDPRKAKCGASRCLVE